MVKLDPELQKKLDAVANEVVAVHAIAVDRNGIFPSASMAALASVGVYGLISA